MASQAQIDANRRNAQHSTGPVSAAGKAVARMNALKSGLYAESIVIRGEDPAALNQLIAQHQLDFAPQTAGEQALVDNLVAVQWLLARHLRIESQLFEYQFSTREYAAVTALGEAWLDASVILVRLGRRYDSLSREHRAILKELRILQAERRAAEVPDACPSAAAPEIGFVSSPPPGPGPEPAAAAPPQPAEPEIGFVPSNRAKPPAHTAPPRDRRHWLKRSASQPEPVPIR